MEVAGRNLFENQYYAPGRYEVYWDGRGGDGKVVLPGNYVIRIYCQGQVIATTSVIVKGTLKSGTLAANEHWTEEGEPINNCRIASLAVSFRQRSRNLQETQYRLKFAKR
jgi:hypothetical protein